MPVRRIKKGEPGYGRKKFVATGEYNGKPYTVRFGDPKMDIKRDNPKRKKAFRDRMGSDNPGPPNKAKYHSCKLWGSTPVSKLVKG